MSRYRQPRALGQQTTFWDRTITDCFVTGITRFIPARVTDVRRCIQKFPDWVDNEIYAYYNKHSLRSNIKGYGGKIH
jgi:hypothetical protein